MGTQEQSLSNEAKLKINSAIKDFETELDLLIELRDKGVDFETYLKIGAAFICTAFGACNAGSNPKEVLENYAEIWKSFEDLSKISGSERAKTVLMLSLRNELADRVLNGSVKF